MRFTPKKLRPGPGGVHCPCCVPTSHVRWKRLVNRSSRRHLRLDLAREVRQTLYS